MAPRRMASRCSDPRLRTMNDSPLSRLFRPNTSRPRLTSALALSALLLFTPAVSLLCAAEALHYLAAGGPRADLLAPPPMPGSAEQAADMAQVVAVSRACSSSEASVAFAEKKFSILTFTPAIGSFFHAGKFPKTEAFCERVLEEAKVATDHARIFGNARALTPLIPTSPRANWRRVSAIPAAMPPRARCSRWCWPSCSLRNRTRFWPLAGPLAGIAF